MFKGQMVNDVLGKYLLLKGIIKLFLKFIYFVNAIPTVSSDFLSKRSWAKEVPSLTPKPERGIESSNVACH